MKLFRKFTIIELLVAISIIGILTSMLMPSLAKARERTKAAVCKSNLRQINIAFVAYSDGNNDAYPLTTSHRWTGFTPTSWDDRLSGYDGRTSLTTNQQSQGRLKESDFSGNYGLLYSCPSDTTQRSFGSNTDCIPLSYAVNYYYNNVGRFKGIIGYNGTAYSLKMGQVTQPVSTIIMSESAYPDRMIGRFWGGYTAPIYVNNWLLDKFLHKGIMGSNYIMADGHVEYLDYYSTLSGGTVSNVGGTMWDAQK